MGKVWFLLTTAFSVVSLTGAFLVIGSFSIVFLVLACYKTWTRVDELANITEPLNHVVGQLKERVDTLEQKIKDE